jgi:hypothetical protein
MRANAMIERGYRKYGVILAFDVPGAPRCRQRRCFGSLSGWEARMVQNGRLGSLAALLRWTLGHPGRRPGGRCKRQPAFRLLLPRVHRFCCPTSPQPAARGAPAVTREAGALAEQLGVRIFTADIIYHLFDQFTAYLKQVKEEEQEAAKLTAVFPCRLKVRRRWRQRPALFLWLLCGRQPTPACSARAAVHGRCGATCKTTSAMRRQASLTRLGDHAASAHLPSSLAGSADPAHLHLQPEGPHHPGRGGGGGHCQSGHSHLRPQQGERAASPCTPGRLQLGSDAGAAVHAGWAAADSSASARSMARGTTLASPRRHMFCEDCLTHSWQSAGWVLC